MALLTTINQGTTMKTTFIATLLATAVSASFAAAPTAALNHDPATYQNVTKKAAADYKMATAKCTPMSGSAKSICIEEAKAARARTEADAIAQYNNTPKGSAKARTAVAEADFSLAKAKCADMTGTDKDNCMNNAHAVHTAAVADAKAGRTMAATTDNVVPLTSTTTREAANAAAVEKCAQVAGQPNTGCLIDNRTAVTTTGSSTTATTTAGAGTTATTTTTVTPGATADKVVDKTRNAAAVAADKTRDAAASVVEKTKEVASTAAEKTRNTAAIVAGKTERATETVQDKSAIAANKTSVVVADSVITTKVKADIFKEPELKSMAIHVETEKGVVMLSGFVDSKADADKAVRVAKSVEGVSSVKSAIKVK
jgi:hyperosmotically inducible protein